MRKFLLALLILPALTLGGCGIEIVDAGNTGVKKHLGKVDDETLPPGFYMVNPFTTNIIQMDNQVQKYTGSAPAYTKDVQQATVDFAINYNLQSTASAKIYRDVGRDYVERLMPQVIQGSMKNIVGKWNAIELVSNRGTAQAEIRALISTELAKNGLTVSGFELTNIDFVDAFEKAVEDKVVAVQLAEESKNKTVRIQEEAKQKIISAEADARAMQIKTAALKESQSLVMYEAVQKWNGILPQIISGDGGTLLNIPESVLQQNP